MTLAGRSPFIGRREELRELRRAFEQIGDQRAKTIVVTGEAGIGKSDLLERFLDDLINANPGAVILHGRCVERESVPFKSFDGIVDALSSHLNRLDEDTLHRVVPPNPELLARAFPVLRRLEIFSGTQRLDILDLHRHVHFPEYGSFHVLSLYLLVQTNECAKGPWAPQTPPSAARGVG